MHREFIKQKTKEVEDRYKKYKNKLINIIRAAKKVCYKTLLDKNRNNIKGIWSTLNSIIKNGSRHINYPRYFLNNNKDEYNMDVVVNSFNRYFVNVGLVLAE